MPPRRELAGAAALLALAVALAHGPALDGGFVYDDHWTIVENDFLRSPGNLGALLTAGPARAGVPDAGRPLLLATELLDQALWGAQPRGWHLQNLLWHLAVVLLFFGGLAALSGSGGIAFTAAALVAVHPLNVEAVAAINYREDLLVAFFVLAALLVLGAARRKGQGRGRARGAAFVLLALGGFAKESAAVAPILLVLLDVSGPPPPEDDERRARRLDQLVLVAAALGPIAWRAWVMGGAGVVSHTAEIPPEHRLPWLAVPQASWSFLCGLGQWLFPWRLAADYSTLPTLPAPGRVLLLGGSTAALLAAVAVLAWRARHGRRWVVAVGVMGALVAYLPTWGLVPISNLRADRYFYLASLPLALAMASALAAVPWLRGHVGGLPRAAVALAVVLVVLSLRSRVAARAWRDDLSLWTQATRVEPGASRAWNALGEARLRRGQVAGARAAVETSLALADDPHARELLGIVLMEAGDLPGARRELARALEGAEPHHRAEWLNNLGHCELELGLVDEALARFAEARRLAPGYDRPWLNAARALDRKGDHEGARRLRERAPSGR